MFADEVAASVPEVRDRIQGAQRFVFTPGALQIVKSIPLSAEWAPVCRWPFLRFWIEFRGADLWPDDAPAAERWGFLIEGPDVTTAYQDGAGRLSSHFLFNFEQPEFKHGEEKFAFVILRMVIVINTRGLLENEYVDKGEHNRKRERRGKPPLFSHHICRVRRSLVPTGPRGEGQNLVRAHVVRGHPNRRGSRSWWVDPYGRGNAARGIVTKDYRV